MHINMKRVKILNFLRLNLLKQVCYNSKYRVKQICFLLFYDVCQNSMQRTFGTNVRLNREQCLHRIANCIEGTNDHIQLTQLHQKLYHRPYLRQHQSWSIDQTFLRPYHQTCQKTIVNMGWVQQVNKVTIKNMNRKQPIIFGMQRNTILKFYMNLQKLSTQSTINQSRQQAKMVIKMYWMSKFNIKVSHIQAINQIYLNFKKYIQTINSRDKIKLSVNYNKIQTCLQSVKYIYFTSLEMMSQNSNSPYDSSFFQCYICMQTVKKPKMCPSCSKLACENCLRKWIQDSKSECPHCRKVLPLSGFADCERFVNDIKRLINNMDSTQRAKQKCKQHKLQMQYFCQQCKQAICSDCGMFGVKHKGHSITHLSKIYQANKDKILNELARFDQKIQSYRKNGFYIKLQIQKLNIQIGQKKSFIQQYFLTLIERLEEEFREKKIKFQNELEENCHQIQLLGAFRDQISLQLQGKSQKEVIANSDDLISEIHKLCEKQKHKDFEQGQYCFETIQQIVPKYESFNYVMIKELLHHEGITYSEPYTMNGIQWRLKLYPRGNGIAKDSHISVFLQMSKAYSNENKYEYKIELINHFTPKDTIIREYSSKFDIGECWGYNQFIPLNDLQNGFINCEGCLHFNISVRNPTYKSLVRDQQNYIKFLQNRLKSNQQPVSNSRNREIISKLSIQHNRNKKQLKKTLLNDCNLQEEFKNKTNSLEISDNMAMLEIDLGEEEFRLDSSSSRFSSP